MDGRVWIYNSRSGKPCRKGKAILPLADGTERCFDLSTGLPMDGTPTPPAQPLQVTNHSKKKSLEKEFHVPQKSDGIPSLDDLVPIAKLRRAKAKKQAAETTEAVRSADLHTQEPGLGHTTAAASGTTRAGHHLADSAALADADSTALADAQSKACHAAQNTRLVIASTEKTAQLLKSNQQGVELQSANLAESRKILRRVQAESHQLRSELERMQVIIGDAV